MTARSVTAMLEVLQWLPTAFRIKIKSLQLVCRTICGLVSVSSPESRLCMTPCKPTTWPSFLYIIKLILLSPTAPNLLPLFPCSLQPVILSLAILWTCQWLSPQGVFIWYSFHLEYSFSELESHGLAPCTAFSISFKRLLTEAFLDFLI